MKQLLILIYCLLCYVISCAQEPSKVLVSNELVYDFGQILEKNGKVSHTFNFYNKGDKPVVISDVATWCGCTTTSYAKKPILPGKTATVTVTYSPYNRPGSFSKEMVVLTESGRSYSRVWIKGHVIPYLHPAIEDYPYTFGNGLCFRVKILAFGSLRKNKKKTVELGCANDTDQLMTLEFKMEPYDPNLKFINIKRLNPRERYKMSFSYTVFNNYSFDRLIKIYPVVNGKCLKQALLVTFTKI